MATTATKPSGPDTLPPELLALGLTALGGFLAWHAGHTPLSRWAFEHHLFTTDPVFEFPSAATPHTGPTIAALVATVTLLLTAICAAATITGTVTWLRARHDPAATDRERRAPTVAGSATLATGIVTSIALGLTVLSGGALPQSVVLAAAAITATAVTTLAVRALRPHLDRAELIAEITAAIHSYLGYTRIPTGRIVTASDWHGDTPHTLTLTYTGRLERLPKELGDAIDTILGQKYALTSDRKKRRITATVDQTDTGLPSINRLRTLIATPTMFEAGATVTDIDPPATPDFTTFTVNHKISHKLAGSARAQLLERKVSEILPGRWRGAWDLESDHVTFTLRPEFPDAVTPLLPRTPLATARDAIDHYETTKFAFADDEDGNPLTWDPKRFPHALIIGTTGSGKTSTTHTLITQASLAQWPIVIIDFKGLEYTSYRTWPNVQMVITEVEEAMTMIELIYQIMLQRNDKGKLDPTAKAKMLPFLIVIDEFTEFVDRITEFYNRHKDRGAPKEPPTLTRFYSIARLARTTREHLVVGLQRPDATIMDGEGRDNFIMRISMGKLSRVAADMMWESSYIGRTVPPGVRGRGTARNHKSNPVEVQCYYTPDLTDPDPRAQRVINALRPKTASHERLLVVPSRKSAEPPESFNGYLHLEIVRAADRPDLDPVSPDYYRISELADVDPSAAITPTNDTSPTPTATTPAHEREQEPAPEAAVEEWFDRLELEPQTTPIPDLEPGDCVLIDDHLDRWAILSESPIVDDTASTALLVVRDPVSGAEECVEIDDRATVLVRPEKPEEIRGAKRTATREVLDLTE
ncbi:FtsK/SpoIIIE domain-containing protein [Aldersonia sp. NBC_00410]|uniref:FtsK/SpoIIIE domain-containing protein n=1 Tax=Aldersonia sp. NBC_00410 TaxID=2975954 RepID=UPI0022599C94|nr:FtsK/SpoIIIE domain-containing protein [Aldersonia sp. NBC_00410]MCX5046264.1 FtsK/SpoIIIE domain-containing protein [Aldersonia sp. NBC_00410]